MSARFFLDTNLLIYAIDSSDARKQAIAQTWLANAHESGEGVVSYQVVQEWFHVVLRKAAAPLSADEAGAIYRRLIEPLWRIQSSREVLDLALDLHGRHSISWWDALIVSAAIKGGCGRLLSEDLQHGRKFGNVEVVNPFLTAAAKAAKPKRP